MKRNTGFSIFCYLSSKLCIDRICFKNLFVPHTYIYQMECCGNNVLRVLLVKLCASHIIVFDLTKKLRKTLCLHIPLVLSSTSPKVFLN